MEKRLGGRRAWFIASALLAAALFALSFYARTGRNYGTWRGHVAAGAVLLRGGAPETPAYPMWGYSFAAGALEDGIVVLQGALALPALTLWYGLLRRRRRVELGERGADDLLLNPLVFVALMIPWLLLSGSYYSNSLGGILVLSGTTALVFAVYERRGCALFALAGLLFGLAVNVRTEYLAVALGLLASLGWKGVSEKTNATGEWVSRALAFAAVLGLCTVPWAIYTGRVVGRVVPGSSNSGGVMYLSLGIDPANPWRVIADDRFVHGIAEENFGTHAWSPEASDYFRREYVRAARDEPVAFALRVLRGWRLMLMQGLYLPPSRDVVRPSARDFLIADDLNERLKGRLGLSVNARQVAAYERLALEEPSLRHYFLVLGEYFAHLVFLAVLLGLLALSLRSVAKRGVHDFMSLVFISYGLTLLVTAGLIQTLPRHTTLILPILVGCAALAPRRALQEPLDRALRGVREQRDEEDST